MLLLRATQALFRELTWTARLSRKAALLARTPECRLGYWGMRRCSAIAIECHGVTRGLCGPALLIAQSLGEGEGRLAFFS
jgi:hypothetical protein